MGKSGKKGGKRLTKKELLEMVLHLFQSNPEEVYPMKTIFRELGLNTHPLKMLCVDILLDLVDEDYLTQPETNKFRFKNTEQILTGVFQRKNHGKNQFLPDDAGEPILIAEANSAHAMNGDRVKVAIFARQRGHSREGEVIEIIERAKDTFVGTLQVGKNFAFLACDNRTSSDIFIPREKLKGGKDGQKAVVKIVEWPDKGRNPIGVVLDVLGNAGNNDTEMHAILAEYGLPYSYPKNVEAAANRISDIIPEEEIAQREDFRNVTTFTIDPRDAKDFDDALSVRKLPNGLWEVGVHIADVTYFVKEGGVIDKEAVNRATSVYLVDRTIPMLPERLCNELCSLRQDEEKVAYSVILHMNDKAEVKHSRIVHTLIKSNRRFTYEEAQAILEQNGVAENYDEGRPRPQAHRHEEYLNGTLKPEGEFAEELIILDKLAKLLRDKRFKEGAINFDRYEVRFEIDDKGKPLSVYFKYSKDANKLVEEFMLLANRTVAETIGKVPRNKKAKTFVYRIHDLPDPEKLDKLKDFITRFGYKLKTDGTKTEVAKNINSLLDEINGKPEQNLIETVSVRTMMKAKYSTHNIGHYGLAFEHYTHFTSPIRRYPDMMVHRLLTRYIDSKGRTAQESKYEELCEHCSAMEQTAASAERSSIKYKQVEFMQDHLGQEFEGTVSGVTEWGLYVEINENKCEGMIPIRDLDDGYFIYDDRNYCLYSRDTNKRYSLGDSIKIKVAQANLERKQLDFVLASRDSKLQTTDSKQRSSSESKFKKTQKSKKSRRR